MKLSDLKIGDCICADSGFTCLHAGFHNVEGDDHGLFIKCSEGNHYLDGQENEVGELVGLSPGPDFRTTQEVRHDAGLPM